MYRFCSSYALAAIVGGFLFPGSGFAHTPESAEVKAMVKRGLEFMERGGVGQVGVPAGMPGTGGDRVGDKAVVALAFFKSGKPEHKLVKEGIQRIYGEKDWKQVDNYSLGLAIILLAELEDPKQLPMMQQLVDEMVSRQQKSGGFGYYKEGNQGDTSQIQYAALSFWNARMAGAKVPQETIERVCDFLIRVQDPTGGWNYNGTDPGNYQRVQQSQVTHSLTAAGLGSICVCADLLGINRRRGNEDEEEETGLPSALKVVKKPKAERPAPVIETKIDPELVERAIQDGQKWFAQNYKIDTAGAAWNYYYLYGLERCESYRELYYGKFTKEPKWYNDGVQFLSQKANAGGWSGDHSAMVTTSFAILFLQRSARKAIAVHHKDLGDGVLTSGKGLPTDLANASLKRGKVVDSPLAGEVDDIVAMLDDPENPELSRLLESNEEIKLDPDLTKRTGQVVKLRSLVTAGNWEARMVAVRGLGKARDLDSVPSLIFALTDPDVRVVQEADGALRFISRKFTGVGLAADPDRKNIQKAREGWRNWYLSIRPDAELID